MAKNFPFANIPPPLPSTLLHEETGIVANLGDKKTISHNYSSIKRFLVYLRVITSELDAYAAFVSS